MSLRLDFMPWEYAATATEQDRLDQAERHRSVAASAPGAVSIAPDAYLADSAAIFCDELAVGPRSFIAAHAYVTGTVSLGADTTINPFTVVRGQVSLGSGVRVGAHTSLLGFNHGTSPGEPIFHQPLSSLGISVGDDVWIGSNVVVLDGVHIGAHAVVGAGAVVTRDVPEWAVVVGNPARVVRDRRSPRSLDPPAVPTSGTDPLPARLAAFADRARAQAPTVLARAFATSDEAFVDRPGAPPTPRAWCDAIEIADLLLGGPPPGHSRDSLVARLHSWQDPVTGLVGGDDPCADPASYHILCVGYALRLLGSSFAHPISAVRGLSSTELETRLAGLDWEHGAWGAGHVVDGLATAMIHSGGGPLASLVGWLTLHASPATGLWGSVAHGTLEPVNGFYRISRGVHAQLGLPLPYPAATVTTVLAHAAGHFEYNACNILDIIHPLWLAGQQTAERRPEGETWAADQLDRALTHWVDDEGFAFAPDAGLAVAPGAVPGLQGTEMWLAIIWLLADYLGVSSSLGYRPRGVHRPFPGPGPGTEE